MTDPIPGAGKTYTGTIDWGDGTPTSAASFVKTGTNTFNIFGQHTYPEEGPFPATVTINSSVAQTLTLNLNVPVSDPSVVATGVNIGAQPNVNTGTVAVATFTDPGGPEIPTADYRAVINWGDG